MKRVKWIKIAALGILLYQSVLPLAQVAHAEDLAPPVEVNEEQLKSEDEVILAGKKRGSAGLELPDEAKIELDKPVKSVQSQNQEAIWTFDAATGTLTISGGTIGAEIGEYTAPWLGAKHGPANKNAVKKIEFTGDVTGNASLYKLFADYQKIETIEFNDRFDTSAVTDMESMFYGCSSLTSVDVNSFDTSAVTNMWRMFLSCNSLTDLDVSNFDTSAVTNMGYMFDYCSSLTSVDVSNFDTSAVTNMVGMFFGCNSLTGLDVGNFDTSAVTNMGTMFRDCTNLTGLDVNSFDTSAVTNMVGMFFSCNSLTGLDVSNFDTSAVTDMTYMFYDCRSLTSVDVNSFDTSKVTSMVGMFYGCSSLTSLDMSTFDTSKVQSMSNMFNRCSSLTSLDVSNFDTSAVTSMGGMFYGCSSLTSVDVSNFNTTVANNSSGMSDIFANCPALSKLTVGPDFTFGAANHGLRDATWYQNKMLSPTLTTAEIPTAHNGKGQTNTFATGWVAEFDTQGGSLVDPILVSPTGTEAERTITKPTTDPIKSGHTFEGWYQDTAGTTEFDFTQPISEHTTIYAKWKENTYQVTFKADSNGTLSGKNSVDVAEGKTLTASQVPMPVADKGYQFSKWIDNKGNTVTDITKVAITKDQTFTAIFKKQPVVIKKAQLYRLYNPNSGEHFYTQNEYERKNLLDLGWHDEGVASEQPTNAGENVYRLYNPNVGEHHYTPHKSEVEFLKKAGWDYEGTAFKSGGNKKVHRLYNPNAVTGTHHYTLLDSELNWLKGLGWSHENTGWYSY